MFLCDKEMTIPQIKFGSFFWPLTKLVWNFSGLFLALFGFLLKFSSGNFGASCQIWKGIVLLLVFIAEQ